VAKTDKEKYAETIVAAYRKILDIAEADPNAESYDDDEMEDL
jgi:hypothetical protein